MKINRRINENCPKYLASLFAQSNRAAATAQGRRRRRRVYRFRALDHTFGGRKGASKKRSRRRRLSMELFLTRYF
jgi:hypothetical protein